MVKNRGDKRRRFGAPLLNLDSGLGILQKRRPFRRRRPLDFSLDRGQVWGKELERAAFGAGRLLPCRIDGGAVSGADPASRLKVAISLHRLGIFWRRPEPAVRSNLNQDNQRWHTGEGGDGVLEY